MDEPAYYVITISMRGYLPDAEPYVIADEHPPTRVLEAIFDEVDRIADQEADAAGYADDAWQKLLDEITADKALAANYDTSVGSGFGYPMPDGYVIEATRYTPEQLIELGYTPGEDFDPPASASD